MKIFRNWLYGVLFVGLCASNSPIRADFDEIVSMFVELFESGQPIDLGVLVEETGVKIPPSIKKGFFSGVVIYQPILQINAVEKAIKIIFACDIQGIWSQGKFEINLGKIKDKKPKKPTKEEQEESKKNDKVVWKPAQPSDKGTRKFGATIGSHRAQEQQPTSQQEAVNQATVDQKEAGKYKALAKKAKGAVTSAKSKISGKIRRPGIRASLTLAMSNNIDFTQVDKSLRLLEMLQFQYLVLAVSTDWMWDNDLGMMIKDGINFLGGVQLGGKLEDVGKIFGSMMTEAHISIHVPIDLPSIKAEIELPGQLQVLKFKSKNDKYKLETSGLKLILRASSSEMTIMVGIEGGIIVTVPGQEPIAMIAFGNISPQDVTFGGRMEGKLKMIDFPPIPGLPVGPSFHKFKMGNIKFQSSIDPKLLAAAITSYATGGGSIVGLGINIISAITGFAVGGEMGIYDKMFNALIGWKLIRTPPEVAFILELNPDMLKGGGLSLSDLVGVIAYMTNFVQQFDNKFDPNLKQKFEKTLNIPKTELFAGKLSIVPNTMFVAGQAYLRDIGGMVQGTFLGQDFAMDIGLQGVDISGTGFMETLKLGPLEITGWDRDQSEPNVYQKGSFQYISEKVGKGEKVGPMIVFNIGKKSILDFYMSTEISLKALGGIKSAARLQISPSKLHGEFEQKLGGLGEAKFAFTGGVGPDWMIAVDMKQDFLHQLEIATRKLLPKFANQFKEQSTKQLRKLQKKVGDAKKQLDAVERQVKKCTGKLKDEKQKRAIEKVVKKEPSKAEYVQSLQAAGIKGSVARLMGNIREIKQKAVNIGMYEQMRQHSMLKLIYGFQYYQGKAYQLANRYKDKIGNQKIYKLLMQGFNELKRTILNRASTFQINNIEQMLKTQLKQILKLQDQIKKKKKK